MLAPNDDGDTERQHVAHEVAAAERTGEHQRHATDGDQDRNERRRRQPLAEEDAAEQRRTTSGAALCRTTALATLVRVIARMNRTNEEASSRPESTPAHPILR